MGIGDWGENLFFRFFCKRSEFSTTRPRKRLRRDTLKLDARQNLASGSLRDDTRKLTTRQIAFRDCRCREGSADSNKFGRRPSLQRHPIGFYRVARHENHTKQHEKKRTTVAATYAVASQVDIRIKTRKAAFAASQNLTKKNNSGRNQNTTGKVSPANDP